MPTVAKATKLRRADIEALTQRVNMEKSKTSIHPTAEGTWVKTVERIEVFHSYNPGMPDIIFDVRAIKDAIVAGHIACAAYEAPIDQEWYDKIVKDGGIEEGRIEQLTGKDLQRILIAVKWPQGWTQIIDGNNRFVKRYRVGLRTIRFVVVPVMNCLVAGLACEPGQEAEMLMRRRDTMGLNVKEVRYQTLDPHGPEAKKLLGEEE